MRVFSPLNTIEDILQYWWLVALLAIWGGIIGWYIHTTLPALYQAEAVLTLTIDYTQTDEITLLQEDRTIVGAAQVFFAQPVAERVVADAQDLGINIDLPSLWDRTHFERKQARWLLRVRHPDPQVATVLAELWAQHGFEALVSAHGHALRAQSLRVQLQGLQGCLPTPAAEEGPPAEGLCALASLDELSDAIQAVNQELELELVASRGLMPALLIGQPGPVSIPSEPAQFGRNSLVLAGALIGFLLGIVTTHLQVPERLAKVMRRG